MSCKAFVCGIVGALLPLPFLPAARASVTLYSRNLAAFNAAAGNPPIRIDFDQIAPNTDITGTTIAGVKFTAPGAPLIVVAGADTVTPNGFTGVKDAATNVLLPTSGANVLSPGGAILKPGPNSAVENDDLTLDFDAPIAVFGFDFLSQSADGYSVTTISVYDSNLVPLYSGPIEISNLGGIGAPGGADFWGIVSTSANIKRIRINEDDSNAENPDSNAGYDTFRFFVPGSFGAADALLALKAAGGLVTLSGPDKARLNVETAGASQGVVDRCDALRLMRKVAGLDANP